MDRPPNLSVLGSSLTGVLVSFSLLEPHDDDEDVMLELLRGKHFVFMLL